MVDVTTTVRQHPVEGLIRYAFMAGFAVAIGAGPGAFAIYRVASALNGLLEHANVRCPWWLDRALSWLTTWPSLHKLHHSRRSEHTDTNYGNLFSVWDRLFGTLTPVPPELDIAYGLAGCDAPSEQKTIALLVNPFRSTSAASEDLASP
jgi:sterol desaturase/sphingolipid hydroxylase (fatty acid hydroxylase superfamily)